jgi:membrane-bound ClpP family serine protease
MNTLSRTITGMILIVVGIVLLVAGFYEWTTWIYGIPILIIGLFILFNKNEDKIERRKDK